MSAAKAADPPFCRRRDTALQSFLVNLFAQVGGQQGWGGKTDTAIDAYAGVQLLPTWYWGNVPIRDHWMERYPCAYNLII